MTMCGKLVAGHANLNDVYWEFARMWLLVCDVYFELSRCSVVDNSQVYSNLFFYCMDDLCFYDRWDDEV